MNDKQKSKENKRDEERDKKFKSYTRLVVCLNLIAVLNAAINPLYQVSFYIHWLSILAADYDPFRNRKTDACNYKEDQKICVTWRLRLSVIFAV